MKKKTLINLLLNNKGKPVITITEKEIETALKNLEHIELIIIENADIERFFTEFKTEFNKLKLNTKSVKCILVKTESSKLNPVNIEDFNMMEKFFRQKFEYICYYKTLYSIFDNIEQLKKFTVIIGIKISEK